MWRRGGKKEWYLGRRESCNYISFLISFSKMPNVNVTKHTCLASPNASFPPSPTHPWSCLLRPPTSLFLCGAAGQRARPAAGVLSPGLDLEHGCSWLSRIQAPWGLRGGSGGWRVREVGQRGRRAEAASSTVLDHLQRAPIPVERLDSSAEREGGYGGSGRKRGKMWETRDKGGKY